MRRLFEDYGAGIRQWVTLAVLLAACACAGKEMPASSLSPPEPQAAQMKQTAVEQPQAPAVIDRPVTQTVWYKHETGIASWYGKEFHGRKTASGEIFDMFGLSAAHRTLPLGALIRVTNLENLRSIVLIVNDRGPFSGNRILEMSYGASRQLGFASKGTARVDVEIESPVQQEALQYTVHAGLFAEETSAQLLRDRLSRKFEFIRIEPFETNLGKFYRVYVGSYGTDEKAEKISGKLKLEGLEPLVMIKD